MMRDVIVIACSTETCALSAHVRQKRRHCKSLYCQHGFKDYVLTCCRFQSARAQPTFIDLTNVNNNDDNDRGSDRASSRTYNLQSDITIASDHGLLIPGPTLMNGQIRSGAPLPAFASTHSHSGSRNVSMVGSRGDGQIGGILGHGNEHSFSSTPNPAKRRKTDGGTSAAHPPVKSVTVFKHGMPIQAPQARVSTADGYQNDPRMHRVINDPVLKTITKVISRYTNSISKKDRDRIARQV